MHEYSLACNIVEIVEESAKSNQVQTILCVELEIGTLSGVEVEALLTALEATTQNTIINGAEIKTEIIEGEAQCMNCDTIFNLNDLFELCPKCGGFNNKILKGKQFRVKSIVAE